MYAMWVSFSLVFAGVVQVCSSTEVSFAEKETKTKTHRSRFNVNFIISFTTKTAENLINDVDELLWVWSSSRFICIAVALRWHTDGCYKWLSVFVSVRARSLVIVMACGWIVLILGVDFLVFHTYVHVCDSIKASGRRCCWQQSFLLCCPKTNEENVEYVSTCIIVAISFLLFSITPQTMLTFTSWSFGLPFCCALWFSKSSTNKRQKPPTSYQYTDKST